MIYGKLAITMLSTLASSDDGSTNYHIAQYLLSHPNAFESSISELASECHVSKSTISRFCRDVGLSDFAELKELMRVKQWDYERIEEPDTYQRNLQLVASIKAILDRTVTSINNQQLMALCQDIIAYEKVAAFGLMKASTVAQNLQADLLLLGKVIETKIHYAHQQSCLLHAKKDKLIIIFSYSGIYFDAYFNAMSDSLELPKIVMITGQKAMQKRSPISEIIAFDSDLNQLSHPYQMQLVGSMIAQGVAQCLAEKASVDDIS